MKKSTKKIKTLLLFSGGLDSILAAKILINQGRIDVTGLFFKSYFFGEKGAKKAAKKIGIKFKVSNFSKEHLKIVKKPKYGYGSALNPCIDCHLLMLKKAKKIMEQDKFDFVATGEVLGERPMSQNRKVLELIEKESSLSGYLLRPLSAKLLKETIPEKKGWVEREKLFDIFGRSRKKQIELAKRWKIDWYPTPAGGCLLTDLEFSKKLKELFQIYPQCQGKDIELLKFGRHFWDKGNKIIIGRNEKENKKIKKMVYPVSPAPKMGAGSNGVRKGDILIEMENYAGPLTLIRNYGKEKISKTVIEKAKNLTQHYSTKARGKFDVKFKVFKLKC